MGKEIGVFSGGLFDASETGFEDVTDIKPEEYGLLEHDVVDPEHGPAALYNMTQAEKDKLYDLVVSDGRTTTDISPLNALMRQRHPSAHHLQR